MSTLRRAAVAALIPATVVALAMAASPASGDGGEHIGINGEACPAGTVAYVDGMVDYDGSAWLDASGVVLGWASDEDACILPA